MSQEDESTIIIPEPLVNRAKEDPNFALRLLLPESRDEAIREAGQDLTDDQRREHGLDLSQRRELSARLDEVATMSVQEAVKRVRDEQGDLA